MLGKVRMQAGFGEIGFVWYFHFAGCAGLVAWWGGARGQGCTAGRRSISSYMGIPALGWLEQYIRMLTFVSSLPQVGGVGGGLPVDVVVGASLSCFVIS